jgi:hypothetical protein
MNFFVQEKQFVKTFKVRSGKTGAQPEAAPTPNCFAGPARPEYCDCS